MLSAAVVEVVCLPDPCDTLDASLLLVVTGVDVALLTLSVTLLCVTEAGADVNAAQAQDTPQTDMGGTHEQAALELAITTAECT